MRDEVVTHAKDIEYSSMAQVISRLTLVALSKVRQIFTKSASAVDSANRLHRD